MILPASLAFPSLFPPPHFPLLLKHYLPSVHLYDNFLCAVCVADVILRIFYFLYLLSRHTSTMMSVRNSELTVPGANGQHTIIIQKERKEIIYTLTHTSTNICMHTPAYIYQRDLFRSRRVYRAQQKSNKLLNWCTCNNILLSACQAIFIF